MCRSARQGWRWLPAPLSSNPGRRLGCSGSLQGEDNFACNFMSQSINSHCGGRRKVWALYMRLTEAHQNTILQVEVFSNNFCFVWSLAATPVFSLPCPFARLPQSRLCPGTQSTLRFQKVYLEWLLDFSLTFSRGMLQ